MPKVIPGKIKSQYEEQEEIAQMKESLKKGELSFQKQEGIDKLYLSIKDTKVKAFKRNLDKIEANIKPEPHGTVVIEAKQPDKQERPSVYDAIVNDKVVKTNGMPKFTFETQELFQQADHLTQQIPHWKSDNENPIH